MSVPNQIPIVTYTANGITSKFPITFDLHDQDYLVVTVNKEKPAKGAYSVDVGEVVFRTPPNNGDEITLARDTVPNRDTNFNSYDNSMRPEVFNYDFDKLWHYLQEQNLVDAISLARIKDEIEWRRTHDFNYDMLAQVREKQIFGALKQYVDTFIGATNPNIFGGVTAGVVFALDQKSVQTHLEEIADQLEQSREDLKDRPTVGAMNQALSTKANTKDVEKEFEIIESKIKAAERGLLVSSFEEDLLKEKPLTEPVAGKAYDTRKEWIWETRAPETEPKWWDTGLSDLELAQLNTSTNISNTRKEIQFVPATEFDDGGFMVVDPQGRWLNDYAYINSNLTKTIIAPFSTFDDPSFEHVDKAGIKLDSISSDVEPSSKHSWLNSLHVEYQHTEKSVSVSWIHDDKLMLKTVWQPNGANNLFNFRAIYKSNIADPINTVWELIQQVNTDYIPPITHHATTGQVSSNGSTTGGNHLGKNGEQTAHMQFCDFYLNNIKLDEDFIGYVENINVRWQNLIYAGNTINEKRFATQQDVFAQFYAGNVEVDCEVTALEPIKIWRDGGTQLVGQGWGESYHFYGGVQQERIAADENIYNGGTKLEAPNQWAVVLKSPTLGFCAAYIDRAYGIKFDAITDTDTPTTKNVSSYKFYNFVVKNEANQYQLNTGQKYAWRGGYAYAPISVVEGLDSAFIFKQAGRTRLGISNTASQLNGSIHLNQLSGKDFEVVGGFGVNGLNTNFSEYQSGFYKELN